MDRGRPEHGHPVSTARRQQAGTTSRDVASTRVHRTARGVAVLAAGVAVALGLVVSKELPGTAPASASSSTSSGTASSSPTSSAATTTTTTPLSTSQSATVVSGGTAT